MADAPLTPREHEVMSKLIEGKTNKQIAKTLDVAEHTVETHLSNIFRKYGAASRVEAALRYAGRCVGCTEG